MAGYLAGRLAVEMLKCVHHSVLVAATYLSLRPRVDVMYVYYIESLSNPRILHGSDVGLRLSSESEHRLV